MTTPNLDTTTGIHEATAIDYEALYLAEKAEKEQAHAVLAATRSQTASSANANQKPVITADRFKATVGPVAFLNMTRDAKLRGMGADPAAISDDGLYALFGRGNDGKLAQDLMKSNPGKYRTLKEYALVLNIYGAKK
jgi:hypothetical protein